MAATIRDVANLSGYSVGTISKYINGQPVKEATKIAIEHAIQQLNYSPNNIAKGLRNSKSFSIAILLPMLNSSFCTSMISSIESCLLPEGYSVIVCECHNDAKMELQKTQFLIDRMVDGIILIPYASDGKQIEMIQKHNIPLVVLDQKIDGFETETYIPGDCIELNDLENILKREIDYKKTDEIIKVQRENTINYLRKEV